MMPTTTVGVRGVGENLNESKVLYAVMAIMFAMVGWIFNKIVNTQAEIDDLVNSARQTIAVMEHRLGSLEKDCGRE